MSEPNDAPPPEPPVEPPATSPFPESSLTPPPVPPVEAEPSPVPPAAPPAPVGDEPERRPWMESAPPPPAPPQPTAPAGGGLVSGDPLGGTSPAPPAFPPGYTSPPPPGAGGEYMAPTPATPAAGTYRLAGWGRRVGAFVVDMIVLLVPFLVVLSALGVGFFGDSDGADDGVVGFIVAVIISSLVFAVIALLYAPVMMARTNGKTLGRMATGIRVVRADGSPITFGFAAIREIAVKGLLIGGLGGAITFGLAFVLDSLWPLWDDENRALHDFVVNTRTVMDQ